MTAELQAILQRLDNRIERAIAIATDLYGTAVGQDPYRGLYISPNDVELLLNREPLVPLFSPEDNKSESAFSQFSSVTHSSLQRLQDLFNLSTFDLDLIVIALAPEIDPRYERLYAYLQDDVQCRRPSVNLALDLLCTSAEDKLARRAHLGATAPLIFHSLLHLISNPGQTAPSLLGHFLTLDTQVVNFLLGQDTLDSRLAPYCHYEMPGETLEELTATILPTQIATMARARAQKLYFQGNQHCSQRQMASAIAASLKTSMLVVDLDKLFTRIGTEHLTAYLVTLKLTLLFRPALFYGHRLTKVWQDHTHHLKQLLQIASAAQPVTILSGEQSLTVAPDWLTIPFDVPPFSQRRALWQQALQQSDLGNELGVSAADIDALADRFILGVEQIRGAVTQAELNAQGRIAKHSAVNDPDQGHPNPKLAGAATRTDLFAAARTQSSQDLTAFTQKITPIHNWQHLILPDDTLQQLQELCAQVQHRHTVFDQWGYGQRLSVGKGLNALFSGPPGTGKTTAAEVIAQELQLDLYKINLSQVVSKYIGETEKNLDRIFTAARTANAILLFDEADALFGKRSEVRDAHDRYANIEISYLLQKMEAYEGISLLTTNLRQNLDEAFVRRLAFIIHFPAPDEVHRRQIWSCIWPQAMPLADDLDFDWLAQQFKLSGGNIKNIALAAAFLSADEGDPVNMEHVLQAVRREYQKMGQTLTTGQLIYPSK